MNAVLCFIMQYINEISNEGKKPVGKKCLHADYCVKFIQMMQILCFYELNTSKCTVWMFLTCKIQQLIREIMCKVPGILEIFVFNAWSCNVTLECRLCIGNMLCMMPWVLVGAFALGEWYLLTKSRNHAWNGLIALPC